MKHGFIKVAAAAPEIRVADPMFNADAVIRAMDEHARLGVKVLVFPELTLTGATCGDLFYQNTLLAGAAAALEKVVKASEGKDMLVFVGLPVAQGAKVYDAAAVVCNGELLGVVPASCPGDKHFALPGALLDDITVGTLGPVDFHPQQLFQHSEVSELNVAVLVGADVSAPVSPAVRHALAGATVLVEMAGFPMATDSACRVTTAVRAEIAKLHAGVVLAAPSFGESSTDATYSGLCLIAEDGKLLECAEAVKMMGLPADYVNAVTMPCFGTTDRTKSNAIIVSEQLGATVRVIDIGESVMQHFKDIGHDPENRNVVYENAQARERTQILMDVANGFADGGIHVGTEDMSEFADGWCTYNGDHISMYDVNAGSTKTMVQMVVRYVAETTDDDVLSKALLDVLDTPVSPELLPPTRNGEIAQKSEDSVGPYNLQDFFLYYLVDHGFAPEKVLRLADIAYGDEFDHATLKKWLRSYCRRLFSQQFKRSCLQDGPTLNGFSFSPRTGFLMPSDGSDALYLASVDALK